MLPLPKLPTSSENTMSYINSYEFSRAKGWESVSDLLEKML